MNQNTRHPSDAPEMGDSFVPSMIGDPTKVPAFAAKSKDVNAIVHTPRGSQNKFKFDEESGLFMLGGAMPAGATFPFEFGFVPSTRGGDGDPLDLLILMDAPTFVGCLVRRG